MTIDDVRAFARGLPRSTEVIVRDRVKFRVGRLVYVAFSRDEKTMGFGFPKAEREALVASEPHKFQMPDPGDLRYHWVHARLDALDEAEMRELVLDAWRMVVPRKIAAAYDEQVALGAPGVVALRDVTTEDLPVLFEHQNDRIAAAMVPFEPRGLSAFMHHWTTNILGNDGAVAKAIVLDGEVVGNVVSWESEEGRLVGYWVGREHWGRGIATAALGRFVHEFPERPLYATVAASNAASIRVLEKCGFTRTEEVTASEDGVEEIRFELST